MINYDELPYDTVQIILQYDNRFIVRNMLHAIVG